ncbi:MAG: radical SAM protein [Thermoanaerobaculia bacterium]
MTGRPSLKRLLDLFLDPVTPEKRRLLAERWASLDPSIRVPTQGLGQKATGCGATIGIQPRCDFACTGCYLGDAANRVPALPTSAILGQLRQLRAFLGPKSNVQITDGEVTLRPVDELIEILRYARAIGVVPMLMTHGDTFRTQPGLLARLVGEALLTEVSIHVDITQRGRMGYRAPRSEAELMPLRDEFAAMIREVRRTTGRRLRAATTMTVTRQNLPEIGDIVRWTVRNRDAFSLISLQPAAQVGRTRKRLEGVTARELWDEVSRATSEYGATLADAEPLHFGHPDCTRIVPLMAIEREGEARPCLMQLIRDMEEDRTILQEYTDTGLLGMAFRDDRPLEMAARALGAIRTRPSWFVGRARRWVDQRLTDAVGTALIPLALDALRGKVSVSGVTITSHHFMSPEETATDRGRERLDACVFRLPYKGQMVPMCQMNAMGVRDQLYGEIIEGAGHEAIADFALDCTIVPDSVEQPGSASPTQAPYKSALANQNGRLIPPVNCPPS